MQDVAKVDQNFAVASEISKPDAVFWDAEDKRFRIFGVFKENGMYRRMPQAIAETASEGSALLHQHTAGGRICFKTNSPYVAISAKMNTIWRLPHFTLAGSAGFDMYVDGKYHASFIPVAKKLVDGFTSVKDMPGEGVHEVIINFPLYSGVTDLYIGLAENSMTEPLNPYGNRKPVVFYGPSITQGACASRPGNSYPAVLSRRFGFDYINLGFSGRAKGEPAMAEYIANIPMSLFVYDYDGNAPDAEYLKKTHKPMFDIIRAKQPDLPILMMSMPNLYRKDYDSRYAVIRETYQTAVDSGDKNVYLIDGRDMVYSHDSDMMTVDNVHPNDFGFWCMAEAVENVLKEMKFGENG